jgi:hypothetical protein
MMLQQLSCQLSLGLCSAVTHLYAELDHCCVVFMLSVLLCRTQVPWKKIEAERVNKDRTPEEAAARTAALIRKDRARAKRIAAVGIEYEYEPLEAQRPQKARKVTFD